jgi:glutamine synthetase
MASGGFVDLDLIRKVQAKLANDGVQYAVGSYVDIHGVTKGKLVPISAFNRMVQGSELYTVGGLEGMGPLGPNEDECAALPDLDSMVVAPWDRRYVWMASNLEFHGEPYEYCSRTVLRRLSEQALEEGFVFNLGFEPEFYILREQSNGRIVPFHSGDVRVPTNGYDVEATLDAMPVLDDLLRYIDELGWAAYSFDHEGGHGQFEIDFGYAPALQQADRFVFLRLMIKEVAKQHGSFASFMPKPFEDDFGSGAHFNLSLGRVDDGANLFEDSSDASGKGFSSIAYQFLAGLLRHAKAITAVSCPNVNSYKRLVPLGAMSAATWAPAHIGWGYNNRSLMCRLPMNRRCIENRAVDFCTNPYLSAALHFAAGLEGVRERLEPPKPLHDSAYQLTSEEAAEHGVEFLPKTLVEALEAFESDALVDEVFGKRLKDEYLRYKWDEWDAYRVSVSQWERDRYLRYY